MQYTTQAEVTGIKMFKDTIEGTEFDTTKLFVRMDLDASKGQAKGYAINEYSFGTSDEYRKLEKLDFPMRAEITIETVTTGKRLIQRVVSLKPVGKAA